MKKVNNEKSEIDKKILQQIEKREQENKALKKILKSLNVNEKPNQIKSK
jgi:hypothetical protein